MKITVISLLIIGWLVGCTSKKTPEVQALSKVHILSVKESIPILLQTVPALADTCMPTCWGRLRPEVPLTPPYEVYVYKKTWELPDYDKKDIGTGDYYDYSDTDPEYRPLLKQLFNLKGEEIALEEIRLLNNKKAKFGKTTLRAMRFGTHGLGVFLFSNVVVDTNGNRGAFFYEMNGPHHRVCLVFLEKKGNDWKVISHTVWETS